MKIHLALLGLLTLLTLTGCGPTTKELHTDFVHASIKDGRITLSAEKTVIVTLLWIYDTDDSKARLDTEGDRIVRTVRITKDQSVTLPYPEGYTHRPLMIATNLEDQSIAGFLDL